MVVEIGCQCDDLPAHSHVFKHEVVEDRQGNRCGVPRDTGEVRIWVDWKAVAREMAKDVTTTRTNDGCWNCGSTQGFGCCQATVMY